MMALKHSQILRTIPFLIATCHCERSVAIRFRVCVATAAFLLAIVSTATAQYSGGSGTAQDPYQIATAADLIALGETPADYDEHFILTADIDLDPNLPGRKVFDKAVIPSKPSWEGGIPFAGVFDGNGHTISHLVIAGGGYLGLFGQLASGVEVKNLGVVDVNITGSSDYVGGLVGRNWGAVAQCYSTGAVNGNSRVGGLVGLNNGGFVTQCYSTVSARGGPDVGGLVGGNYGAVTECYSTGPVSGRQYIGGLVGYNDGSVTQCYSTGAVSGTREVGGLVGENHGAVTECYSTGAVSGDTYVGGLVGDNQYGPVTQCYSTGPVSGTGQYVGGLAGSDASLGSDVTDVTACFWDVQTSGQAQSAAGTGLTTAQMQDMQTYKDAGWDFVGEMKNGTSEVWQTPEGGGYPVLAIFSGYLPPQLQGLGTPEDPYLISDALELGAIVHYSPYAHYRLAASIDLSGIHWGTAVVPSFAGTFDGNGHTISHLTVEGAGYLGLLGQLESGGEVKNLGVDVNITGSGHYVGGLVGENDGDVTRCYSTGTVSGKYEIGGLVGWNDGSVTQCYSTGAVSGDTFVAGLVAFNNGSVTQCYSTGAVSGDMYVGGLVGHNWSGSVTQCYSTGPVSGNWFVGGLVGWNLYGPVTQCYSTGAVSGTGQWSSVGGLVGDNEDIVLHCVWDMETSGLLATAGGVGLTTAEMMDPYMLGLNGFANDPNWVLDAGRDYPRLAWEGTAGQIIPEPHIDWLQGGGTAEDPYRVNTAEQLIFLGRASALCDRHFVLGADIDLDPNLAKGQVFPQAVIPTLTGVFDGNGHCISHLTITGGSGLGLFGQLASGAVVKNLGLVDVKITGSGGALVGSNGAPGSPGGVLTNCYSTGRVTGSGYVGGLVGNNYGGVGWCYSTGAVTGSSIVGGLVGYNDGSVTQCHSTGVVSGTWSYVGGLVGWNWGAVTQCYSTGAVSGDEYVGGLVGENCDTVTHCYSTGAVSGTGQYASVGGLVGDSEFGTAFTGCVWDIQASGQAQSAGGTGLSTAQMKDIRTYLDAGWDFVGEADNGTHEVWQMPPGGGYPVLAAFNGYTPPQLQGMGTLEDPYLICDALELGAIVHYSPYAHYRLAASIDLSGVHWAVAVIPSFAGTFDGNGLTISHLTIKGQSYQGLFGRLEYPAEVKDIGVVDVNVTGSGDYVGGLMGYNGGVVTDCSSTGAVNGNSRVGGLVGCNRGTVTRCYSTGTVSGSGYYVGGLVGLNDYGAVTQCYSCTAVNGGANVGGLVGNNGGTVIQCCSTGAVSGNEDVGGLVGYNWDTVTHCYSTGAASGKAKVGGLVGSGLAKNVTACFWDTQTSRCTWSLGGTGKTTAEMHTAKTFLDAGWDFVGETTNGTEDIWRILEGKDYPRLWWEAQ